MNHIKGKTAFEDFPEKSGRDGTNQRASGMDPGFRYKFVKDEHYQKSQTKWQEILKEEIIDKIDDLRVDKLRKNRACPQGSLNGRPDSCDGKREKHDNAQHQHDHIFDKSVVKKRFMVFSPENLVKRRNQVRKQKGSRNQRPQNSEPAQVIYILAEGLKLFEKRRVHPGKEFLGKNVQTSKQNL